MLADYYALGITCWVMMAKRFPWNDPLMVGDFNNFYGAYEDVMNNTAVSLFIGVLPNDECVAWIRDLFGQHVFNHFLKVPSHTHTTPV